MVPRLRGRAPRDEFFGSDVLPRDRLRDLGGDHASGGRSAAARGAKKRAVRIVSKRFQMGRASLEGLAKRWTAE
jgi:hypothetical protein